MPINLGPILLTSLQAALEAYTQWKKTQGMKDDEARKQALIDAANKDKATLDALHQVYADAGALKGLE